MMSVIATQFFTLTNSVGMTDMVANETKFAAVNLFVGFRNIIHHFFIKNDFRQIKSPNGL